ncbi:uncharacterized protein LOC112563231 [Pomacea canaliculata]|uniref:uncharacterized protein LOC112563231 n=1 Tax=Pomacea canaliculata TaxID=400727 RepID=UPI000D72EBC8|nr:uncharacterized protein LOC112563231 [Pomacea canaliculata]
MSTTMATMLALLGLALVALLGSVEGQTCEYPPCPSDYPETLCFPYWRNCDYYYNCTRGVVTIQRCPNGMDFDFYSYECVTPPTSRADLRLTCRVLVNGIP